MVRILYSLIFSWSFLFLTAQGTRLLRQPDVSRDQIVFTYANDLWIASKNGENVRRLTSFQGTESNPHFSPDGQWIAFSGEYAGNTDVYVVASSGGEPRRLTWHPGSDDVCGWSPAGKIIFKSGRTGAPAGSAKLWSIGLQEGLPQPLPMPRAYRGDYSPDGKHFAYEMVEPWDEEWRNYRGGQNRPIWILDLKYYDLITIPWTNSHDMQPHWVGQTVYFLSDRNLSMNLYSYSWTTKEIKQLTFFSEYDIKYLGAGDADLIFEYGGDLYHFNPQTQKSARLSITIKADFPWIMPHWKDGSDWLTNGSLSPAGKRALFEARGEIITVPVDKGNARNLTNSPGARDHDPVWSPDGNSIAWFSDASGEYSLMIGEQNGQTNPREIKIPRPTYYYSPKWSPDGKYIAYTDHIQQLWMVDVANAKIIKVDQEPYLHPERSIDPVWSADGRYLAYAKRLNNMYRVIMVFDTKTLKSMQLTDGMSDALSPAWDKSGKYLYFLASTNLALSSGWLDMSSIEKFIRRSVYLIVLNKKEPSPFLPESDEEAVSGTKKDSLSVTTEDSLPVIDLPGISQRILALDMPSRYYTSVKTGEPGEVFIAENIENQPESRLHKYTLKERKAQPFLETVQEYSLSKDGKKLLYRSGSFWRVVDSQGKPSADEGMLKNTSIQLKMDPRAEWKQIFREAWRYQRDFLYVDNVHGADWNKVYAMYEPLLAHVAHRSDLNYLLDILGGEVSIGHSFVAGGDHPEVKRNNVGLLGADLEEINNRYRIKKIYNGENWNPRLRAPLSAPGVDAREGDYLLAVNGQELTPPVNPYSLFENKANQQVVLTLSDTPDGRQKRMVTVVPVSSESSLRTMAWVEENRRKVDALSGGKLAYVWLPNTGEEGYEYFNRYYFAQQDKEGVVLDERFNGGGYIADYFVDILNRKLRGYFNNVAGDQHPWSEPLTGIFGPKVLIVNEMAGSGGDMLPYLFRHMQLGPLVGTKTWGGLVGIWDTPALIDGGFMTAPRGGFFDLEGRWDVENVGIAPDITVEMLPKEVIAGKDPQLERAVEEALKLLPKYPVKRQKAPAAPIRALRPKQ